MWEICNDTKLEYRRNQVSFLYCSTSLEASCIEQWISKDDFFEISICYLPALVHPHWEKLCPKFWLSRPYSKPRVQFFLMRTNQGQQMTSLFSYLFFSLRSCFKAYFVLPFSLNLAYAWVSSTESNTAVCRNCRSWGPVMQTKFFFNLSRNIVALQVETLFSFDSNFSRSKIVL